LNQDKPETLLKSALEKIVYFEARSAQLANDLAQKRSEVEHLKTELGQAAQREIELRGCIAELEVRAARAHSAKDEAARVTEALKRERGELIGRMLDASRIQTSGTPQVPDDFDLAQFIAQLRSEVLLTRDGLPVAVSSMVPLNVETIESAAKSLQSQGRLEVSHADVALLQGGQLFQGRNEETLFGFSVRELSAPDAGARVRAAERLKALKHAAAAPVLAQALHHERMPKVQVALLDALANVAQKEAVPVVTPLLQSPSPDVRIAALKALLALDATRAAPHVSAALKDGDKAVRRRASLLGLSFKDADALAIGAQAMSDSDADVRSLAALILAASNASAARPLLTQALNDSDAKVRRSASQALSSLLGHNVSSVVSLDDAQRRREVRKLSSMPLAEVIVPSVKLASRTNVSSAGAQKFSSAKTTVAVVEAVTVQKVSIQLAPQALGVLRASLRGQQLPELAEALCVSADEAFSILSHLMAKGSVVRRGHKYFVA
jgi:HEAT repeat protein